MEESLDPKSIITDLRSQLSLATHIGFLCGAGTSMALGIPGIRKLTTGVESALEADFANLFQTVKQSLVGVAEPTVEDILNQVRLIRQVTRESDTREYAGIKGSKALELDREICNAIYVVISAKEMKADLSLTKKFVSWLNWVQRGNPIELYTTNYDLLFERAFEGLQIPYFDGFVGAREPFFLPDSVDPKAQSMLPPPAWTRLWKLHGSLGWAWQSPGVSTASRVVRLGSRANEACQLGELVIYPSKEKYESSRKQPFTAFFDRMRNSLLEGEIVFVVVGFSFSDEHINEILYSSLRANNRLHLVAFCHEDDTLEGLVNGYSTFPNLTALGPTLGLSRGRLGAWKKGQTDSLYWDASKDTMTLGDFSRLVQFLVSSSSHKESIESDATK